MKIIAKIHNDYKEKFGIPRQSGLDGNLISRIVFEPEYRVAEAIRGIDSFSHLWLIWKFSQSVREDWSPTVRPPRLGGNKKVGVFATRSPFRPNPIGLSSVRLLGIEKSRELGSVLLVGGADLLDQTPIYDIKPYISFSDSHPDAKDGFAEEFKDYSLTVDFSTALKETVSEDKLETLMEILKQDPRPSYHNDPEREYGMRFANYEIFFKVSSGVLTVTKITKQ